MRRGVRGERPRHGCLVRRERRRVEDHDVELLALLGEVGEHLERVAGGGVHRAPTHLADAVIVFEVALRRLQRRLGLVDEVHRLGTARRRRHREATGAGEHVEHILARRHAPDERPVVALVEEVTRLLAVDDVGLERQPAFAEEHGLVGRGADDGVAVRQPEGLARGYRPAQAEDDALGVEELAEHFDDHRQVREPRRRVQLDHERAVVPIDDETG